MASGMRTFLFTVVLGLLLTSAVARPNGWGTPTTGAPAPTPSGSTPGSNDDSSNPPASSSAPTNPPAVSVAPTSPPAPSPSDSPASGSVSPAIMTNVTVLTAASAAGLGPAAATASLSVNIGGGSGSWGNSDTVVVVDAGDVFDASVDDGAIYKISAGGALQPIWSGSPLTNPIAVLPNAGPFPFNNPGGYFVADYKSCFLYLPFPPFVNACPNPQTSPADGAIYFVQEGSAPVVVFQGAPLVNPAGLAWLAPNKLLVSDYGYETKADGQIFIINLDPNRDGQQGPFPVPSSAITTFSNAALVDPAYSAPYKQGFIVGDAGGSLLSFQKQGLTGRSYSVAPFAGGPLSQGGPWQPTGISRQGNNALFGDFFRGVFSTPLDGSGGPPQQLISSPCPATSNAACDTQDLRRFLGMDASNWQSGVVLILNTILRHDLNDTVTGVPLDQEFPPRVLQVDPINGGYSVFYPASGQSADPIVKTPFDIKFIKNDYFAQVFRTMLNDLLD